MRADVPSIAAVLAASDRDAEALVATLDDRQGNWRPRDGAGWSICECLDHLAKTSTSYLGPMTEAAEAARARGRAGRGIVEPGWFGRWFIGTLEPPPRVRVRALRGTVPTHDPIPVAEALARFLAVKRRVADGLQAWRDLDLQHTRFRNPFVPLLRFTLGTGFLIIAAHDRRHLWQARRVTEAPGFPRS